MAATGDVSVVLLDVEGTTTPVAFVFDVLFPFARAHAADFLARHASDADVVADVALLRNEHARDAANAARPAWGDGPAGGVAYLQWLIDQDRKSTALKALQGRIWEEGFAGGELRGVVYSDVPRAFARWSKQGRRVAIFSSGSVRAQQLLFHRSTAGDLTPWLSAHFDTTTGSKLEPASYARIAAALEVPPAAVLFVSDVAAELDAAAEVGMRTALCVRPGTDGPAGARHSIVRDLDAL